MNRRCYPVYVSSARLVRIGVGVACILSAACQEIGPRAEPDAGTVSGGVYSNAYFGLTIPFENGWEVVPDQEVSAHNDLFVAVLSAGDRNLRDRLEQDLDATLNLIALRAAPVGLPYFQAYAVEMSLFPGTGNAEELLDYSLTRIGELVQRQPWLEFQAGEVTSGEIGGVLFYAVPVRWDFDGVEIREFRYGTVIDDYALFFNTTYERPHERDLGHRLIGQVQFD